MRSRKANYGLLALDITLIVIIFSSWSIALFEFCFQDDSKLFTSILIYLSDALILFYFIKKNYRLGFSILRKDPFLCLWLISSLPLDLIFLPFPGFLLFNKPAILFVRLFRLVRIFSTLRIFEKWESVSWINPGYLKIKKFLFFAILLIHTVACLWFLTSSINDFPEASWVVQSGLLEESAVSQYIRSLYWTVTTMTTVGYGDIIPGIDIEYIFALLTMLSGASLYALVIGNIASTINSLDKTKSAYWAKVNGINNYLKKRKVPIKLNDKVRDYFEFLWKEYRGFNNVDFIQDLPENIKLEVIANLSEKSLKRIPIFNLASKELRRELLLSLRLKTYPPDMTVTKVGEKGDSIYFISKGVLGVFNDGHKKSLMKLKAGESFGELSLILNEERTANVITNDFCELFSLEKEDFERIKENHKEMKDILKKLAKNNKMADLLLKGIIL
jgi:hypothetical protein